MPEHIVRDAMIEYNEPLSPEQMAELLRPFGVYVYDNPLLEGSDMYGYIFSNKPMTSKQLRKMYNPNERN